MNFTNVKKDIRKIIGRIIIKDLGRTLEDLNYLDIKKENRNSILIIINCPSYVLSSYGNIVPDIRKSLDSYKNDYNFKIKIKTRVLPISKQGTMQKENCFNIKNIILVASGKGGVGKSTIASLLAFNLGRLGNKIGLLDADIYGPSIPVIWNIDPSEKIIGIKTNSNNKQILLPLEKHNVKLMSIGFFAKKSDAMILRGPMITSAVNQMITDVLWEDLDYLIIDLPPGTGDIQISLMQKFPISASVIITTMQNISFADVLRAKNMLCKMNIPILGCIANMSYFKCSNCKTKYRIFGSSEGETLLKSLNLDILSLVPLDMSIGNTINFGKMTNFSKENVLNRNLLNLTYSFVIKAIQEAEKTKNILENQLPIV